MSGVWGIGVGGAGQMEAIKKNAKTLGASEGKGTVNEKYEGKFLCQPTGCGLLVGPSLHLFLDQNHKISINQSINQHLFVEC